MKTNIKILICALVAFGFQLVSSAQVTVPVPVENGPTIEHIANVFATAAMDYGQGWYWFTAVSNGVAKEVSGGYTLQRKDGRWVITQFSINGKDLPIDPAYPLLEFPPYKVGEVIDFQLNVQGYNASGKETRRGWFYKNSLYPEDEISITLSLNYVQESVPVDFTGDHTRWNTGIQSDDGRFGGYYNVDTGTFFADYDPIRPPQSWVIYDRRDNTVIKTVPFKGPSNENPPVPDSGFGLSLGLPKDIVEFSLSEEGRSDGFESLSMNHTVERSGFQYSAKIMLIAGQNPRDYVLVYGYSLQAGTVLEVHGVNPNGTSKLLNKGSVQEDSDYVRVDDSTGYAAYRIVFIGAVNNPLRGFSAYSYRSSYPQNSGGGGDGGPKGKVTIDEI